MNFDLPGYERLADILKRAYEQAAEGKGAQRHANDLAFDKQPMQTVAAHHGIGFLFGQAEKKAIEAHSMIDRGEHNRAVHELLGAINYLAGAIIYAEDRTPQPQPEPSVTPDPDDTCNCMICQLRRALSSAKPGSVVEVDFNQIFGSPPDASKH